MAIDDNTSYELTGAQVKDLANKIKAKAADNIFVGATSAAPGSKGLVPQPQAGDDTKFLKGDGTWATAGGSSKVTLYANCSQSQIQSQPWGNLSWFRAFYMAPFQVFDSITLRRGSYDGATVVWNDISTTKDYEVVFTDANGRYVTTGILDTSKLAGGYLRVTATFPFLSNNAGYPDVPFHGITINGSFSTEFSSAPTPSSPVTLNCDGKFGATPFPMYVLGFDYMNWSQYPSQYGPITLSMMYFDESSAYNMSSSGSYGTHVGQYLPNILTECIKAGGTVNFFTSGDMQTRVHSPNMYQSVGHVDNFQAASAGYGQQYPAIEIRQLTGPCKRAVISFDATGVHGIQFSNM